MSLDQYSPCLCGSGKKLKWCCQDKLRDAAQIYRLISTGQFGHAREALEKKLEEFPEHPLFLRLKLDYLRAAAEAEQGLRQVPRLLVEAGVTASMLLLQRPHSDAAHAALVEALPFIGDSTVDPALDYWERFFPTDLHLDAWTPYLRVLARNNPLALWWLSPILRQLRRVTPQVEELLLSLSKKLPGILGGPPYLPATRTDHTSPLERALIQVEQGMLWHAIATAESLADESPEAAYLAGCLRLAVDDRIIGVVTLANLLKETQSPGLLMGAVTALWLVGEVGHEQIRRTTVLIPADYVEAAQAVLSEGHIVEAADNWTVLSRSDWKEADAIDPADLVVLVRNTTKEGEELVCSVPDTAYWDEILAKCGRLGTDDRPSLVPVPPVFGGSGLETLGMLAVAAAAVVRRRNETAETDEAELQDDMLARLLRGVATHPVANIEPLRGRSLSELASSQDTRDRVIAQTIALLIERTLAGGVRTTRDSFVYDTLGVERPSFDGTRPDVPKWLALLDMKNTPPAQLLAQLAFDPYPGADILIEALELLFDRYHELDENQRVLVFQLLFRTLTEAPESADDILNRVHDRIRQVVESGLAPKWISDYVDVFAGFARIEREADAGEAHAEAATNLQRLISRYANADLNRFIRSIFGDQALPGVPSEGPWSQLARGIRRGIGSRLSAHQLVQFVSDRELGLSGDEELGQEGSPVFVDFRMLARWLRQYARSVVVTPEPSGRLWTPDQGTSPSSHDEGQKASGLWVPGQD